MLMGGETRTLSVTHVGSLWKAALGALLGKFVVVTQLPPRAHVPLGVQSATPFVNDVVQPSGSAGATTPSKFSVKTTTCGDCGVTALIPFLLFLVAASSWPPQGSPEDWTHSVLSTNAPSNVRARKSAFAGCGPTCKSFMEKVTTRSSMPFPSTSSEETLYLPFWRFETEAPAKVTVAGSTFRASKLSVLKTTRDK